MKVLLLLLTILSFGSLSTAAFAQEQKSTASSESSWKEVEDSIGRKGQVSPGDVIKFAFPRKDLRVMVKDVQLKPALALGSWIAFMKTGGQVMVMGDLVLTEDELEPVMLKLQEGGVQESAVHNHLIGESPRILYMHISTHGDAVRIARAIRDAIALTNTPAPDAASAAPAELGFDQKAIEEALGHAGKINGGVLQVSVPCAEQIKDSGMIVPPAMGVATAINLQPTGGGKAAVTGDFVLLADEVNPVLKTLRQNGIDVTALHSHMLTEEPRLFFMHFWANDDALRLAKALRAALDHTNSAK